MRPIALGLFLMTFPMTLLTTAPAARAQSVDAGDALRARFEYVEAADAYARALRQSPDDASLLATLSQTWNDAGQDHLAAARPDSAEACFARAAGYAERATKADSLSADAWFFLAAAYGNWALFRGGRDKVRLGRAVESHALRALSLDPTSPNAPVALGIFYREVAGLNWVQRALANALFGGVPSGTLDQSESYLRQALALDARLPIVHFELARTLSALGRADEAARHYRESIALAPTTSQDVRNAAEARKLLGLD